MNIKVNRTLKFTDIKIAS